MKGSKLQFHFDHLGIILEYFRYYFSRGASYFRYLSISKESSISNYKGV